MKTVRRGIFVGIVKHVFRGIHLAGKGALLFNGLTRRQPHLLGSAIQGHDKLPQKVHAKQPVNRGRVELPMRSTDQAVQAV